MTVLGIASASLRWCVLAPIVEEMIFRGLLFGALAPRLGIIASALITALIFGAVHGDLVLFPTLAALGLDQRPRLRRDRQPLGPDRPPRLNNVSAQSSS